jgi:hypothetical protein
LICNLTNTYPSIIWEVTTDGTYAMDLTGWETDGGLAIELPATGKAIITLYLSADGTTKYAFLAATEVS